MIDLDFLLVTTLVLVLGGGLWVAIRIIRRRRETHRIAEVFWDSDSAEKWDEEFGRSNRNRLKAQVDGDEES